MRVNGVTGGSQTPSMGLQHGCPLSATLFGLLIDTAGIKILQMRLRELVYADDICLLASSPEQLQALIDALAASCATLQMEISVPKTKVMVVSAVPVATLKYLGLHFHQSGSIAHLVMPIRSKAGGSWAAVQRRNSLLQCGSTISLHLHLLQAILVPVLQYGCQIWGMHSPQVAAANDARDALQRLNDYYPKIICRLVPFTPCKLYWTELGLLPLQVFWWRQTLQFWNSLASLPIGSLYHTNCLDNLTDVFWQGACNMANSLTACWHSVGFEMPCVHDVVPLLDVDGVVEALTARLQSTGSGTLYCPRAAPTQGVVSCTYEQWFKPYSPRRRYGQLPVSERRMQQFLQFRLGCHGLPIATGRLAGAGHVGRANRVCLACKSGGVGDEKHMIFECTALAPLRQQHADLFTPRTDTMRSFFAQQNHLGVLNYVIDCLNLMNI